MDVALVLVTEVAATPPKVTDVVPVRLVPVRTTDVPPTLVPEAGEAAVIVGATAKAGVAGKSAMNPASKAHRVRVARLRWTLILVIMATAYSGSGKTQYLCAPATCL
jgi:hypothetical protein